MRLISMLAMLIVLGMIIARASDPATWKWLAGDDGAVARREPAAPQAASATKAPPRAERVTAGPTDEDIEEQDGAYEEFMALTDGGLEQGKEEMPAYWRLFRWVQHQSTAQLRARATKNVVFNRFIRDPGKQRGKLFQLELNVRKVVSYDAPKNSAGVKKVYEIWGFTRESQAWLYAVLVEDLPEGMPVGTNIDERVAFTGYFFKLQGYYEAGAGPRDKPLVAPLLIGRVTHKPSEFRAASDQPADWTWVWWAGGLVVVFGILRMGLWVYNRWTPAPARDQEFSDRERAAAGAGVRNWLAHAEGNAGTLDAVMPGDDDDPTRWNGAGDRRPNLPDFHNN